MDKREKEDSIIFRKRKARNFSKERKIWVEEDPRNLSYKEIVKKQKGLELEGKICGGCKDPECELKSYGPVDSVKPRL